MAVNKLKVSDGNGLAEIIGFLAADSLQVGNFRTGSMDNWR